MFMPPPISDMAQDIVVNAKMRRTGVCGAAETLLVDRACAPRTSTARRRR
jgi:glutamate-5-semialdehyde dehydrogenase